MEKPQELISKVRAAIKDRATWFALLYRSFNEALPEAEVQRLCRAAIYEFGRIKAARDPQDFSPQAWVRRHVDKGSSLVFDSEVEVGENSVIQRMRHCALVEAWKEMGCSAEEIDLFCDIAMAGDRGRAEAHGMQIELDQRIGKGDPCCELAIFGGPSRKPA